MYLVDGRVRRLHPEECRRLMGFPEGFRLHPRRNVCYKQFGNSVAVPVVSKIVASIDRVLDGKFRRAA
jgi:DNA (cytosine-5)-methyltransferase 1